MYQFEIRKDSIKEVKKSILIKLIVLSLFLLGGVSYSYFKNPNIYVLLIIITIMLYGTISGYNKAVNQQIILYDS